ncbi:hypothetical protein PSHT_15849 [Puccinia striiformis]|uniref:Uncharacterized protein n=1 Tax=Puccinia striiformis TaxID=27350 RepID=A0A2S4UCR3_9BASI|nr:hypothetical protein PSHT_15849 [Puccinia striiformis]
MKLKKALTLSLSFHPENWRSNNAFHLEEEKRLWASIASGESPLNSLDMQAHSHALEEMKEALSQRDFSGSSQAKIFDDKLWKEPYEWDEQLLGGKAATQSFLNTLLCKFTIPSQSFVGNTLRESKANSSFHFHIDNPPKDIQSVWLIGDGKTKRFSHDLKDITLVNYLMKLYDDRSGDELKQHLSCFFERVQSLNLRERNTIQDTAILDFIILLATITEVNKRSKRLLDPFANMIQEYVMLKLPGFESKVAESGRTDIQNLMVTLRSLWDRN